MNPSVLKSLFVVRGTLCLGLQQKRSLPSGSSRGGADGGLFCQLKGDLLNEVSAWNSFFLFFFFFHFTFEVSDFCSPIRTTQPALQKFLQLNSLLWKWNIYFPQLMWHCVFSSLSNSLSPASLIAASSTPSRRNGLSIWAPRTPSWRLMMADSRTFSRISLRSEKDSICLLARFIYALPLCFVWKRVAV